VRSSPRSVPPVDQCPIEIFRSCRALSGRLAALSSTAAIAAARKAPGSAPFSRSRPMMQKYRNINRSVWLRRRDSNRHLSNRTADRDRGDAIRLEMGRGPKAGYRGGALQSCQPAAIDEGPGRLINSRAATTQTHRSRPRPGHEKPAAEIRAGIGSTPVFPNSMPNGPPPSSGNVG